ncbi:TetR/AcrR family transcriptional regulator [Kitasatospora sp. NPDC059722]|uniref:TetR/AcrR family transcriptional regulator n=1 Tax=unclassified Kitasatospora TaxID=2633591 RepID=UPI003657600A
MSVTPVQERKQRERAQRERLIVAAARELAERQGWEAVTTRRLAERIGYSQPVLYGHFRGKREIIGAVALEGAAELAATVRAAAAAASSAGSAGGPRERAGAVARAYLGFAAGNPALYDALFHLDAGLAFAREDTPGPLKDAFTALLDSLGEAAGDGTHPALFTEVFWAALHGLATLARAARLPPGDTARRTQLLVERLTAS